MTSPEASAITERLAEALVLADLQDLRSLANVHTQFCELNDWASAAGDLVITELSSACGNKIERIILDEIDNAALAFENVGKVISNLQAMVRDGHAAHELPWPADLRPADEKTAPPAAVPHEEAGTLGEAAPTKETTPTQAPAEEPGDALGQASTALEGDPSLLGEFVNEAREHLEAADINLLNLESAGEDGNAEALNAVFRAFHTIKGVAGFLALHDIKALAHEAENLLDRARKGELEMSGPVMDVTFDAVDTMKGLIAEVARALETGAAMPPAPTLPSLVKRINRVASGAEAPDSDAEAPPAVEPGQPLGEILLESGIITKKALNSALDQQHLPRSPQKLGDILVREGAVLPSHIEMALDAQRELGGSQKLGEILLEMGAITTDGLDAALHHQTASPPEKLGQVLVDSGQVTHKDVAQALRAQSGHGISQVRDTVKVDADRLDLLVDMIGELVIAESMVRQSNDIRASRSAELARSLTQLGKITRELQEMGTGLRMVPIRATFQKMARLVRDLAKKANKQVEFIMVGEDTELDKSVVDKIGDPLIHMIRNSVDHGLEADPEVRRRAGKPPVGRVTLRAFHKGGSIHVDIEDDGRGLDKNAILAKARDRGMIHEGAALSDHEIYNLIFEPGLSTAKTVTDVSGRGVGMDVVKRNIESLRGQVEISSEEGKGTTFSIRLPLTMAIIDGMVVSVGEERYIIPTLSIVTSIRPETKQVSSVVGRGEVLSLQGRLLPLFRLSRLFQIESGVQNPTEGIAIVVEDEGRQAGLLVDRILGQQQTVIKSLGDVMQGIAGIAGGAIMPDGNVGLILDVSGVVRLATDEHRPPLADGNDFQNGVDSGMASAELETARRSGGANDGTTSPE